MFSPSLLLIKWVWHAVQGELNALPVVCLFCDFTNYFLKTIFPRCVFRFFVFFRDGCHFVLSERKHSADVFFKYDAAFLLTVNRFHPRQRCACVEKNHQPQMFAP